ncbi:MAG TPA: peptidylprolyl isomerase [Terriglobia bacterium]|nr:peptidylprolyl isomerase [Terriglobia bacterium]
MLRTEEMALAALSLGGMALFHRKGKPKVKGEPHLKPEAPAPEAEPEQSPIELDLPAGLYAVFETTLGRIVCQLFDEQAPVTVQNFVDLVRGAKKWHNAAEKEWEQRPYYNGLTFHRVIPKFMIQGGDYMGNGTGGVGYTFEDEFVPGLVFDRPGRLAMANAGPNTNGAQFFITVEATPWLDHKHSIFGEVVEGQDVANAISQTPRDVRDRPLKPVLTRRVVIVEKRTSAADA